MMFLLITLFKSWRLTSTSLADALALRIRKASLLPSYYVSDRTEEQQGYKRKTFYYFPDILIVKMQPQRVQEGQNISYADLTFSSHLRFPSRSSKPAGTFHSFHLSSHEDRRD